MLKEKVFFILLSLGFMFTCSQELLASEKPSASSLFGFLAEQIELKQKKAEHHKFFTKLQKRHGFNGVVLIADNHQVIYEGAFGYTDLKSKNKLLLDDQFQLASVSKQFTAFAIMMLHERGYLSYDDKVVKYFHSFPYPTITIRQLLTHRSGLPEYRWFLDSVLEDKMKPVSNKELMKKIEVLKPGLNFKPGRRYSYSNTGYAVLASLVEKISMLPFDVFMKKVVFEPLGMKNTRVYSKCNSPDMPGRVCGYERNGREEGQNDCFNGITGDKNVFSNVRDLFIWDQALYSEKLLKQETLVEAFTEGSPKRRNKKNYGFGWRLDFGNPDKKIVYHGGWWHGFRTYFMRNISDGNTLIVLSNKVNHSINSLHQIKEEVAGITCN